jgi:hypothetical protein
MKQYPVISSLLIFLLFFSSVEITHARGISKGIYSFIAANKKLYIGKSIDIERRIKQHIKTGKLNKSDKYGVETQSYNLDKEGLSSVEKTKIRTFDILTNGGLANKQLAPLSRKNAMQ